MLVNFLSVVLVLIGTLLGAVGALVIKQGVGGKSIRNFFFTKNFIIGVFLYGVSTVLYLIALKFENLSVIYPFVSLSFVWTTLLSVKYLREKLNVYKVFGLIGIIIGISFIGFGG